MLSGTAGRIKGLQYSELDQDVVELLKLLWGLGCRHDQNNKKTYAEVSSLKNLLYPYHKSDLTNNEYLKEFNARVESIDYFNTFILGKRPFLMKECYKNMRKQWMKPSRKN